MPAPSLPTTAGPVVAVIGPGRASEAEEAAAHLVGRRVAEAGLALVCGGLGGVMAAACAGARSAGGLTIGLLPGLDRRDANPDVVVAVPTGLGEGRNVLVVRSADAVVAIGGAHGTLSEIALALRAGLPVIGLDTWELGRAGSPEPGIEVAHDAEDAARRALSVIGRGA